MEYNRIAKNYELFIRKVFNCQAGKKYGADEKLMVELFLYEQGKLAENQRIPISRQFFKVRLYIERALIKSKKTKRYLDSSDFFDSQLMKVRRAENNQDLVKVLNTSFSKVIELDNKYRRRR